MALARTPEKNIIKIQPPRARLAAVTKKKNEIVELLGNVPDHLNIIKSLYTEYLTKVETLVKEVGDVHTIWFREHQDSINEFRQKIEAIIQPQLSVRPTSKSNKSFGQASSKAASLVSEARIAAAKEKAQLKSQKDSLDLKINIKQRELNLKTQYEENVIKLQREEELLKISVEEKRLENLNIELSKIEMDQVSLEDASIADPGDNEKVPSVPASEGGNRRDDFDRSIFGAADEPLNNHDAANEGKKLMLDAIKQQNEISRLMTNCQDRAGLPAKNITPFDGSDITQYKSFMLNFERGIESKCSNDSDKLIYLEQFTVGKPQRLVQSCSHYDPTRGYRMAKQQLFQEYGDEFKIANTYIDKLNRWPPIKNEDGESLHELSIFLWNIYNFFENMAVNNQLQSPQEIMNVVKKLPYKLRDRWRRKSSEMLIRYGCVKFRDLVDYVSMEASILKLPLFGEIEVKEERTIRTRRNLSTINKESEEFNSSTISDDLPVNLAANTTDSQEVKVKFCHYCSKNNHYISSCKFFKVISDQNKYEFIRNKRLCFGCLRSGHMSNNCRYRATCTVCNSAHPSILHRDTNYEQHNVSPTQNFAIKTNLSKVSEKILSPIVPAKLTVKGSNRSVIVNCALDTHSTDCWIREDIVKELGICIQEVNVKVSSMTNLEAKIKTKVLNNLVVSNLDETISANIPVVYTKPEIMWPFTKEDIPKKNDWVEFKHLQEVPFQIVEADVCILIGMNIPQLLMPLELVDGDAGFPYATRHSLGWAVNGPVSKNKTGKKMCNKIKIRDRSLETQIETLFSRDFFDSDNSISMSNNDKIWLEKVESSVHLLPNNKYEINLPLRDGSKFPNNKEQAFRMFKNTAKKFRDNDYFNEYNNFMQNMIDNNYMELVPENEIETKTGNSWYLVHHAVRHKRKNKLRIVFNCSLKYHGVSLNDNLLQGPDLVNSLIGVLVRFRQKPVALTADIQQMYYQVRVPADQADYMRLFWYDQSGESIVQYRLRVHVFGATSSPSVANFALKCTGKDFSESKEIKHIINKNFYVDDLLLSCDSNSEALDLLGEVKQTVSSGGFNLIGVSSNSNIVLSSVSPGDLSDISTRVLACQSVDVDRALGVTWDRGTDELGFKITVDLKGAVTKREVLRNVASIFDPIGLCSPALIPGRKLFQEACKSKLDWDDPLPINFQESWMSWLLNIVELDNFKVRRSLTSDKFNLNPELHLFVDGSETAYGAAAYLKFSNQNEAYVNLLASKSRLTPLNNSTLRTVPRIELSSAKLGVELSLRLVGELDFDIKKVSYWSDSVVVLRYIKSENLRFHRFVDNKVCFIRNYSEPKNWHYVPSEQNPADLLSRGASVARLSSSDLWRHGPLFLQNKDRPPSQLFEQNVQNEDLELKRETTVFATHAVASSPVERVIESVSSWYKLKVRVAWLLKFVAWLKNKSSVKNKIDIVDLNNAENAIFKYVQKNVFCNELACIKNNLKLPKGSNLRKLNPFIENNLLRVGGRLQNSNLSQDTKHPIILPASSHPVNLYMHYVHTLVGHLGRESMLNVIRKKYWLLKGSSFARKIVRNCFICRKNQGKTSVQLMSELPLIRVTGDLPAFTHIGVDYFGPFIVSRARSSEKRYGVVFTCASSRAIHLEVSHSLSTDSFICSLRRFISRRGNVQSITSDNGTNFVGSNRELREAIADWNLNKVEGFMKQNNIVWKFNPPHASHFGGFFEREIRSIRKVLNSLLSEQVIKFTDETLLTLFCEIECILNNRPLTEVSRDHTDLDAITPNNLLLLNAGVTFPPGLFDPADCYTKRRWRQVQYLVDLFWTRWRSHYLVLLQERQKWFKIERSHKTGDLVLVQDIQLPRNQWPLGRVVSVNTDKHGVVRSAHVKISKCKNSLLRGFDFTVIERPISKLVLLRCEEELV